WLEADLKANQKQWTIVGMHRPMVCLRDITTPVVTRQQLLDLFVDNGVDLVIQAHEHVYEHTYPVGKNDTVYKNASSRTEDGTKYYVNPEGIMFVTCATGGSDGKAAVDGVDESFFETYAKGNKQSWGNFYIDGNKLSIGVYYYDSGVKSYSNNKFGIIKE
ncbi:MAG: metallophosphoesterase, partial [Clostridia bacterium]|nr:metallophosphoesterase [Clostridia bacterium]